MNLFFRRSVPLAIAFLLAVGIPTLAQPAGQEKEKTPANEIPAQVEAAEQATLFPRITGYVQTLHVDIGHRVKRGQLLAELSVPEIAAELQQKEALIAQADAQISLARRGVHVAEAAMMLATAQVEEGEAAVKRAQASYERSKSEAERLDKLWQTKVIDKQVRDEGQQKLDVSRTTLAETEAKLKGARAARDGSLARQEMVQAEVKLTLTRMDVAKADARRVAAMLQFAKLYAPFDGVIALRGASVGDLAGPPTAIKAPPLLVVTRVDTVRIAVAIPEASLSLIAGDGPVLVRFPACKGREVEAKLGRVSPILDPTARTLRAEIDLPNPDGKLMPGMSAVVRFATRAKTE